MTGPITCDPGVLQRAGDGIGQIASSFQHSVTTAADVASGGGGMAGSDPAGAEVGRQYDAAAKSLLEGAVDTANGGARIGAAIGTGAANHSAADQASCLGNGGAPLAPPGPPPSISAKVPPSSVGGIDFTPSGWGVVADLVGLAWPNGDPGKLRTVAAGWRALATDASNASTEVGGHFGGVTGQQVPESQQMTKGVADLQKALGDVSTQAGKVAGSLEGLASSIEKAQAAVEDLLSRVSSVSGVVSTVVDVVTGDLGELQEIADDIRTVLTTFANEAAAIGRELAPIVEGVAAVMAVYAVMELQQLGGLAYNVAAVAVNSVASFGQAMASDPGATAEMVFGAGLMALSGLGEGGGLALDLSVVGAPAGVALNAAGAAGLAAGGTMVADGARRISVEAAENPATVMAMKSDEPHPTDPNRTADGRFRGGNSRVGKDAEAEGLEQYGENNPGRWVTNEQRKATVDGVGNSRFYDGIARKSDGTYEAIEVKSGSATRNSQQQLFDDAISEENPAFVTITTESGKVETVRITSVEVVRVP